MPRFENEGLNHEKRRRDVDRTVPANENYYGKTPVDLNFNNRQGSRYDNVVRDNQLNKGINPCDEADKPMDYGYMAPPAPARRFRSETTDDFIAAGGQAQSLSSGRVRQRNADDAPASGGRNREKGKKQRGKSKGRLSVKKIIAAAATLLLAIVLVYTGLVAAAFGKINYNEKIDNGVVAAESLAKSASVKNILLLGVDARSGETGSETRSDTMMLVSVDSKHRCIKLTSFLRDSWVYIPSMGYSQKLNAACSSGGYQGVVDAVEYNFGIDVDGYAVVDFEMFKVLVDSIGGVEVDVSEAEAEEVTNHPARYGNVKLDSGKYKLTGEQALAYCRIRKIDTDFVRTQRQRTVMSAILDSVKKSNPVKIVNMIYKSAPYIETDLTKAQLTAVAASAAVCVSGGIEQTKVPFDGTWEYATIKGNSVISLNIDENKSRLSEFVYDLSADEIEAQQNDD